MPAAHLLRDHLPLLLELDRSRPVLDLACGSGRNGLLLTEHGLSVVFADKSDSALQNVAQHLKETDLQGRTWKVDLEQAKSTPLSGQSFDAIICFRYLHRPLFPGIKNAVKPGGLVIYETFTIENQRFGRPNNPDFLLRPGELQSVFEDWEPVYSFEGILRNPGRAVARVVARKPAAIIS